ncbi:MAG: hypothetical protein LBS43_12510, partial [Prevotellaceae bacterium]|nr:hypothetical protein [Prevotellaceae bacterium]
MELKIKGISDKTFSLTLDGIEHVFPADFKASGEGNIITVKNKSVSFSINLDYDTVIVDDVPIANMETAVDAINQIVFKLGGGASESTLPAFEPNKTYKKYEAIVEGGAIYTAKADFTSGASFDADDWNKVGVSNAELDNYLPLAGGVMSGDIGMGNKNLTGAELVEARYFRSPDHEDDSAVYV